MAANAGCFKQGLGLGPTEVAHVVWKHPMLLICPRAQLSAAVTQLAAWGLCANECAAAVLRCPLLLTLPLNLPRYAIKLAFLRVCLPVSVRPFLVVEPHGGRLWVCLVCHLGQCLMALRKCPSWRAIYSTC